MKSILIVVKENAEAEPKNDEDRGADYGGDEDTRVGSAHMDDDSSI